MNPTSSRATAVVATVERLPLSRSARWRVNSRVCACQARVRVAGLGDLPAVLLDTGGVLGLAQPEVAHQLARRGEPAKVADLGQQPERGASRDPAKRAQPADRLGPRLAAGDPLELPVDVGDL